ncbi:MAG: hypothetical protein M1813_006329 [Trichoglossum hirsutum]|nr:MAG: hypothetical protein M1813_006329 [Trichoglossum hirsutum]
MSSKKLSHEDYIVGWICPLEVEQVAVLEMLDEEYECLPQQLADHNVYYLGSISSHNVVIAGLHQPGNNPAAAAVTQMRMTFPNLRFGFLVGIGGGVPVGTDNGIIRLRDVVASKPAGEHSGAIQYDHGKVEAGQFRRTGSLAPPLAVLLNAAQDLAAKRDRPHKDPDHLYRPNYVHLSPGVSREECGYDPAQRVKRAIDTEDDDPYVVVHRGTIASGEMVIKNGESRDELARQLRVLCFEMEAAVALADFPCMQRQRAAAAYARQLFFYMPVDEVKRYVSSSAEEDIHQVKQRQDDQYHQDIVNWLTPVDYAPQQSDFNSRRQEGTGQWLLDLYQFQGWLSKGRQMLLCLGIPGAGKTIITAGTAYLHCNFRQQHEQKPTDLLASLLKQLVREQASIPESMKSLYKRHKDERTRPSFAEISEVLSSIVANQSRTFFIVDALDECQVSDGGRWTFRLEIFNLQAKTGANIFATPRFIPETMKEFEGIIPLEISASDEDIRRYIDGHMLNLPAFVSGRPKLQEEIRIAIAKAVDGMFLLAQLHLDSLSDTTMPEEIRSALKKLPKGSGALDRVYKKTIMERIEGQNRDSGIWLREFCHGSPVPKDLLLL